MWTTAQLTDVWATQHTTDDQWAEKYWDDTQSPHRNAIVDALKSLPPFQSLLEVGCAAGPNLRRIHAKWPECRLYGTDVNPVALNFLAGKAMEEQWSSLALGLADAEYPQVDVALTCYTLAYIAPAEIHEQLRRLLACATTLVIVEPAVPYQTPELVYQGRAGGGTSYPEYWYDYGTRLSKLSGGRMAVTPIHWGHLRCVQVFHPTRTP